MPKNPHEVIRRYPWDSVPKWKQLQRRTGRNYYLLTMFLRRNPPDETPFRLKTLMKEFGADYPNVYQTTRQYFFDSKYFLGKIIIPNEIERDEKTWEWAIDQLHKEGFYLPQPLAYHSGLWGEPSFRQFENYDEQYLREAFNRCLNRLQDGAIFGLTFDGLNIAKELEYVKRRQRMLEYHPEEDEDGV
jgi:hypothetical protein